MSSKSKKKDKKKTKSKDEKIELTEIDETSAGSSLLVLPDGDDASSSGILGLNQKPSSKLKILPALDGQDDSIYEEAVSAMLNSPDFDGYELLSVLPSSDSRKLIAFFKLSK
jgi:hypothetical protein